MGLQCVSLASNGMRNTSIQMQLTSDIACAIIFLIYLSIDWYDWIRSYHCPSSFPNACGSRNFGGIFEIQLVWVHAISFSKSDILTVNKSNKIVIVSILRVFGFYVTCVMLNAAIAFISVIARKSNHIVLTYNIQNTLWVLVVSPTDYFNHFLNILGPFIWAIHYLCAYVSQTLPVLNVKITEWSFSGLPLKHFL